MSSVDDFGYLFFEVFPSSLGYNGSEADEPFVLDRFSLWLLISSVPLALPVFLGSFLRVEQSQRHRAHGG